MVRPAIITIDQERIENNPASLTPIGGLGLHVRVAVTLPELVPTNEPRILQALYPITERMNKLADSVQSAYAKYRELAYLRKPLKTSFTLTLSLVLLLSLLTAVWAAFFSARRMVAPLRDLAAQSVERQKTRGVFRPAFLARAIEQHRTEHAVYYGELLWIIMMLDLWLESHHEAGS